MLISDYESESSTRESKEEDERGGGGRKGVLEKKRQLQERWIDTLDKPEIKR